MRDPKNDAVSKERPNTPLVSVLAGPIYAARNSSGALESLNADEERISSPAIVVNVIRVRMFTKLVICHKSAQGRFSLNWHHNGT